MSPYTQKQYTTPILSPFIVCEKDQRNLCFLVLRDGEDVVAQKKALEKNFQYACNVFAKSVEQLSSLDRPLSTKEQQVLANTLQGLIELQEMLKK